MDHNDKAAQRTDVIYQVGMVLCPVHGLVKKQPPPVSAEYSIAAAQLDQDIDRLLREVDRFITFGTVRFSIQYHDIAQALGQCVQKVGELAKGASGDDHDKARQSTLERWLAQYRSHILAAIDRVPIEFTAKIFESGTPFTAYLAIRDAIGTAKKRVHYFDRYLDADFFDLYLRRLDRGIEIRLVTTRGNQQYGVNNVATISKLVAKEFAQYQLIECRKEDLHDRNLRIDDTVFVLGGSIKDAGKLPTNFARADSTENGHQRLDAIIDNGTLIS